MTKLLSLRTLKSGVWILLASAVYCLGFNWAFAPNEIGFGGLTGIAQVVHAAVPALRVGAVTLVLNIPLFLLGWRFLGGKVLLSSLFSMFLTSAGLDLVSSIWVFQPMEDTLLAAIFGGAVTGFALGVIFLQGSTTGGTDLAARLVKLKVPWLPLGKVLLMLDVAVVLAAAAAFRNLDSAMYGIIALGVSSWATDLVLYGMDKAKVAYIISSRPEEILDILVRDLGRGVTVLHGQGGWSGEEKKVLMCAFRQRMIMDIKRAVKETDPDAFLIVCDAREILGDGFRRYSRTEI